MILVVEVFDSGYPSFDSEDVHFDSGGIGFDYRVSLNLRCVDSHYIRFDSAGTGFDSEPGSVRFLVD